MKSKIIAIIIIIILLLGVFLLLQNNCSPLKCPMLSAPLCSESEKMISLDDYSLHGYCLSKCSGPPVCVPKD